MSVLMTKDKKELIVTCKCGCKESFHIEVDDIDKDSDMYAVLSFMKGNFYADSNYNFWEIVKIKVQRIWRILRNKDYYYSETIMTKADFDAFKEYMNRF